MWVDVGLFWLTGTEQMIILPFTSPPYSERVSRMSWCTPLRLSCKWGKEDQKTVRAGRERSSGKRRIWSSLRFLLYL